MIFDDLLTFLDENPSPPADVEYDLAEERFINAFGAPPPTELIPPKYSREELIVAMNRCVESGDGDILKLLNVTLDDHCTY